jgi:hypothetical protein
MINKNLATLNSHQKECEHVHDESENDDRIAAALGQQVAEDAEQEAAGNLADAHHDPVKSDLRRNLLICTSP